MDFTSSRLCPVGDHLLGSFYVPGIALCVTDMKMIRQVYNLAKETKMKPASHSQGDTKKVSAGTDEVLGMWREKKIKFNLGD